MSEAMIDAKKDKAHKWVIDNASEIADTLKYSLERISDMRKLKCYRLDEISFYGDQFWGVYFYPYFGGPSTLVQMHEDEMADCVRAFLDIIDSDVAKKIMIESYGKMMLQEKQDET